jgi:hypothetical protein
MTFASIPLGCYISRDFYFIILIYTFMKYIKQFEDINFDDIDIEEEEDDNYYSNRINITDNNKYREYYEMIKKSKPGDTIVFVYQSSVYKIMNATVLNNKIGNNHVVTLEFNDFIDSHDGGMKQLRLYNNIPMGKYGHCWNIFDYYDFTSLIRILKSINHVR